MRRLWGLLAVLLLISACTTSPKATHRFTAPPMGWNSWNSGIELTELNIEGVADAMVVSGMRDAGYRYVNLDAGWSAPTRDADGQLRADPDRFPHGMAALADYVHSRGLYLGLYNSPFNAGCGQDPRVGSAGHESTDAATMAHWGVDYLKYDWCRGDSDHDLQVQYFTAMRDALRASGRQIFYGINPNSSGDPAAGVRYDWSGIADMSRTSIDLAPAWGDTALLASGFLGVAQQFETADRVEQRSEPGYFNDPDMMVVGLPWDEFATTHPSLGLRPGRPDLTEAEQRAHFSLWAMLAAPLLAGNDIRSQSPAARAILTNSEVIAVDQDPLADQGRPTAQDRRVFVKRLADGSVAVALLNTTEAPTALTTDTRAVGLADAECYLVRDLWAHTESRTSGAIGGPPVPAHGVTMLRVTPSCD